MDGIGRVAPLTDGATPPVRTGRSRRGPSPSGEVERGRDSDSRLNDAGPGYGRNENWPTPTSASSTWSRASTKATLRPRRTAFPSAVKIDPSAGRRNW